MGRVYNYRSATARCNTICRFNIYIYTAQINLENDAASNTDQAHRVDAKPVVATNANINILLSAMTAVWRITTLSPKYKPSRAISLSRGTFSSTIVVGVTRSSTYYCLRDRVTVLGWCREDRVLQADIIIKVYVTSWPSVFCRECWG